VGENWVLFPLFLSFYSNKNGAKLIQIDRIIKKFNFLLPLPGNSHFILLEEFKQKGENISIYSSASLFEHLIMRESFILSDFFIQFIFHRANFAISPLFVTPISRKNLSQNWKFMRNSNLKSS